VPESPEILTVSALTVGYDGVVAVHAVDLRVRTGTVVALVGPNGAGKTSTLRGIGGSERSRGTVVFNGKDISRKAPWQIARLGFTQVPQGRRLFPQLTVDENLSLGAYGRRGVEDQRERVFDLFPRLYERREQRAASLSGGEQQMVASGRALMASPSLIAMDEPSLGLAPIVVNEVFETIQQIRDLGVSVLLVEQNATQALAICDHVYVLERGRCVFDGDAETARAELDLITAYLG
jgi:branched-chain amino acid transport system ATP-binding protein